MDWSINLPIIEREDPISSLGCDAAYLEDEDDRKVAQELFWDAVKGGMKPSESMWITLKLCPTLIGGRCSTRRG